MSEPIVVVFPLYPSLTQLDFTGPHQVLSRVPNARCVAASVQGGVITADDGLRIVTERLADIPSCAVLCAPGGLSCTDAMQDEAYMGEIKRLAGTARYLTSVCTGSLILAAAGLLRGKRAGCHWGWRDQLARFGAIPDPARVVRDGQVMTGGGVTAGIDFALTLVAELAGPVAAQAIQLSMEYAPAPPFDSGRPETAPPEVLEIVRQRMANPARLEALDRVAASYVTA